jgi:hypothetical protein
MIWLRVEPGYFWTIIINGFRIGNADSTSGGLFKKAKSFSINSFPAIVDTATSLIYVP